MIQKPPQKWAGKIKVLVQYLFDSLNIPAIGHSWFAFCYAMDYRSGPLGVELQTNMSPIGNEGLIGAILA